MQNILSTIVAFVDYFAVAILVAGLFWVSICGAKSALARQPHLLRSIRINLGQVLLLALEVLIISDILHSILHRNIDEITILALTVLIRVFLSYFLNKEIEHLAATKN